MVVQSRIWPSPLEDDVAEARETVAEVAHAFQKAGAKGTGPTLAPESSVERAARRARNRSRVASIICLGFLLFAEAVSVRVLSSGDPSRSAEVIVGPGMAVGGLLVLYPVVDRYVRKIADESEWWTKRVGRPGAVIVSVAFVVIAAAVVTV